MTHIFRNTFLLKICNLFSSVFFSDQHCDIYIEKDSLNLFSSCLILISWNCLTWIHRYGFIHLTIKRIFIKVQSRIEIFKINYPTILLFPEPIITRRKTWLQAVNYYSKYYDEIINGVSMLNTDYAAIISKGK